MMKNEKQKNENQTLSMRLKSNDGFLEEYEKNEDLRIRFNDLMNKSDLRGHITCDVSTFSNCGMSLFFSPDGYDFSKYWCVMINEPGKTSPSMIIMEK